MSLKDKRPNRNAPDTADSSKRPIRKSFDRTGPMHVSAAPSDKTLRWVNDTRNRITEKLNNGWTLVHKDSVITEDNELNVASEMGSAASQVVGWDERTNRPIVAYLMAIDKDLYNDTQDEKEYMLKERMDAMSENQKNSVPGSYVPK